MEHCNHTRRNLHLLALGCALSLAACSKKDPAADHLAAINSDMEQRLALTCTKSGATGSKNYTDCVIYWNPVVNDVEQAKAACMDTANNAYAQSLVAAPTNINLANSVQNSTYATCIKNSEQQIMKKYNVNLPRSLQ